MVAHQAVKFYLCTLQTACRKRLRYSTQWMMRLGQLGSGSRDPTIRSILVGIFARRGSSNLDHDRRRDDDEDKKLGITSSMVDIAEKNMVSDQGEMEREG